MSSLDAHDAGVIERLDRLEAELLELRIAIVTAGGPSALRQRPASLRGVWKGVVIDDDALAAARASLFPDRTY